MARLAWHAVRLFARLCIWAYYRSFRVVGSERIPLDGPILVVANHPNALVDAATVLCAVPRPIKFAAKSGLFEVPVLGWILRGLGAVPVYRPRDRTGDARKNLEMFSAFTDHFRDGGAAAIFPEGHSHVDPELKEVKSGPARIALGAEQAADFRLGLRVVPIGLHYEPVQQFRGEVHVRVGVPFGVEDLAGTERRAAIRIVQERIGASLRPLVLHLDETALAPLVSGIAQVYDELQRAHPEFAPRPRAEIAALAGVCLNHFLVTDPEAVAVAQRKLTRYQRLSARAGVDASAAEGRRQPVRSALRVIRIALGMLLGLPLFLAGCLVGYAPYRLTDLIARLFARREGDVAIPLFRILCGALVFGVFWGGLVLSALLWSQSLPVTMAVALGLPASACYARFHAARYEVWRSQLVGLVPGLRPGLVRVAAARDDLLAFVDQLARRYGAETGAGLLPARQRRWFRRVPWVPLGTGLAVGVVLWFTWGLFDKRVIELPSRPSPWQQVGAKRAVAMLERDAESFVGLLDTLEILEARMVDLEQAFASGERAYPNVEDDRAVRQVFLTYLSCRATLFRIVWTYREPEREGDALAGERAFLLGYAAAVELCRRGMQLVAGFQDSPRAMRKLNEADAAWGLPPGSFDRIRANLANSAVHDELAAATARYVHTNVAAARAGSSWARIVASADAGRAVVARLADQLWRYKWDTAVARAAGTFHEGRYSASRFVATLIGHVRLREGSLDDGLISDAQVAVLRRERLQPGDILLERRNWALSNAFLPGFWTHAAIYTGGLPGLAALGLTDDLRVAGRLAAVAEADARGHPRDVVEALGPGVILSSLESSAGEADALCALRPRRSTPEIAEAVARALQHVGKPYDFDFDFFSTDRLVCTELVYQAYQGPLRFELVEMMGRQTLPANDILRKWDREIGTDAAELDLVCFLDGHEDLGVAVEEDETVLRLTLGRPGLTAMQSHAGSDTAPRAFLLILSILFLLGVLFLRKRA